MSATTSSPGPTAPRGQRARVLPPRGPRPLPGLDPYAPAPGGRAPLVAGLDPYDIPPRPGWTR